MFYCALRCFHSYLWCWTVCDVPSDPPHLLELNTNLVKGLCDDSNKDIFHKPCKEKYHGAKIEGCPPAREAVNGSVHDEHPAFLWGCLVHCENASGCKTKNKQALSCATKLAMEFLQSVMKVYVPHHNFYATACTLQKTNMTTGFFWKTFITVYKKSFL